MLTVALFKQEVYFFSFKKYNKIQFLNIYL